MSGSIGAVIFVVVVSFVVLLLLALVVASRYQKVGPNQVLVISGRRSSYTDATTGARAARSFRIVRGGGAFIWPVIERVDSLSLELFTIEVITQNVYTLQGVPVTVDGVAQVKIASDDVSIVTAAEQFLSKSRNEIKDVALQTLEGHLRAILGTMTVEEIYKDRDKFAQTVQEVSAQDMRNMGLQIISFTIKNIHDEEGYLNALGKARTAEVKRDAQIGEANAARDAAIESAKARQQGEIAKIEANTRIAEADKEYKVKTANYDAEVGRQRAAADLAYRLQENITNQQVRAEEVEVEVVEKRKRIELQEQEALRKEQELEATVKRPAAAEQYRVQTLADARRYELQVEAEGRASAARSIGEGEADGNRARGLAEAEVIKAQGVSEAEAMRKKAEAWEQYTEAAILQMLIQSLPALAEAIVQPLANVEKIILINSGGGDNSGTGATKITNDVSSMLTQLPTVIEALTGIDLVEVLQGLPALKRSQTNGDEATSTVIEQDAAPAGKVVNASVTTDDVAAPGKGDAEDKA